MNVHFSLICVTLLVTCLIFVNSAVHKLASGYTNGKTYPHESSFRGNKEEKSILIFTDELSSSGEEAFVTTETMTHASHETLKITNNENSMREEDYTTRNYDQITDKVLQNMAFIPNIEEIKLENKGVTNSHPEELYELTKNHTANDLEMTANYNESDNHTAETVTLSDVVAVNECEKSICKEVNNDNSSESGIKENLKTPLTPDEYFSTYNIEQFNNQKDITKSTYGTTVTMSITHPETNTQPPEIKTVVNYESRNTKDSLNKEENETTSTNRKFNHDFETVNQSTIETIPRPEELYYLNHGSHERNNSSRDRYKEERSNSPVENIPPNKMEFTSNSNVEKLEIDSLLKDFTGFTKEKFEPGVLFEDCTDCDIRILPIRPLEQRSTPTIEEESLPTSKIIFAELPEERELQINSLRLSEGLFIFRYISEFLSYIQPNDFPVELLKSALKSEVTWIGLITQSLQVEAGFVACLVAGVLLALAVPVVVLSHACYRMGSRPDDEREDNAGWAGNCRRRTLVFILQLLLVLLCIGMVAMFATNEQLSSAVVQSSQVMQTALGDVSTFVYNSHLHLHFMLTQSLDQTLQAVFADLDNVETLLGRPIQRELIRETGLDVALDSLTDMTKEAKAVTHQVERFMEEVRTTQDLLSSSRDKLSDLRQQVELFRRACGPRDRTMCDTIDASGLEVTLRLDRIKSDDRLNRMRRMGGVGLELAASEAKDHFQTVPSRVEADTRDAREDVRRLLTRQRAEVDEQSLALERLARDLTSKVSDARYETGYWTRDVDQLEYWRWIVCMGAGASVLMIWLMLLCSMCCGCCGSEKAAGPTILVTIVLLCLFSTVLWTLVLVGLLVGGHSEVFLCRPLYDEPEFSVLSRLVDKPGVFYNQPSGGFIGNVIYGNNTIDVPIKKVLKDCQDSRPVYPTLGLHRVMDVDSAVGQATWNDVTSHLRSIRANLSHLEVLSPVLTDQLGDLLSTLSVNFTEHRIQMSKPVTGKDLDSFAKQLDNIGNQLRDLATASRIETLSTRTRRLIDSHIRPLEGRKDALVYQLTALEVQIQPLQRQVNQSLSHLKTIQFFINSQGEAIAQRKSREYADRLMRYVDQFRDHVVSGVKETVAPCRPLWDIFNNTRLFLCRHTVDPLNGFWFATMWCLIVLLVATPVCLKLVDYYRIQGARSSGSPSENLMSSEQGGDWSSPGYDIKYSKEQYGN